MDAQTTEVKIKSIMEFATQTLLVPIAKEVTRSIREHICGDCLGNCDGCCPKFRTMIIQFVTQMVSLN